MAKILVVEDDSDFAAVIRDTLAQSSHTVEIAETGTEALNLLKSFKYELIILDWELPEMAGPEVSKKYRAGGGATPILMLTGKREIEEKEYGLDSGSDDYVTKPVHPKELTARVRALLRRPQNMAGNVLKVRNVVLDSVQHVVTKDGKEINLLPREFAVLEFLMRHQNRVFSGEQLIDFVWSSDVAVTVDTVRTCMNRLRNKLDTDGQPSIVRTIYSVGYTVDSDQIQEG
jgi:DNA-binding response OmpR family regulator